MKTHSRPIQKVHDLFLGGLDVIEYIGLLIIGFATTYAIGLEVMSMWRLGTVTLSDLLLMFLYLEVLAMIGVYFRTGKLPVRYPLYIAIVALARYLLIEIKSLSELRILAVCGGVLLIGAAIWVIRHGHTNYPYLNEQDDGS
jgi:protein PsiE